ncbi:glycerol-3-phosphate acyltransferase [Clostridium sp. C2-6-12]|uniref:glycerol-3-phosphate acyltransferase n=1 Tax=Clostridium sp. C2-6-12 TaxID=2698832 RepID=UPI0013691C91|nr:glycerol-3-phosphate acyltransferase [Clostridium sp. C2-6-12]
MFMDYWWQLSLLLVLSYFIGNFSTAIVISNKFIHKDIRELGSKNPGTTNMTRVFGIKYGVITLCLDFFKGFICAVVGKVIFTSMGGAEFGILAGYLAGLAVILGHNYPILLGFKGGKGFASGLGVYMAVNPVFTVILLLFGIILLLIVDRMSVFALTFFAVEAIYHGIVYTKEYWWIILFASIYFVLIIISHRTNIIRLLHGEEKPLGLISILKNGKKL